MPQHNWGEPSPIYLGRYFDPTKGAIGSELTYDDERHLLLFGPNGSGKGTRVLVNNLLQLRFRSIVVIDPKGELTAITADYRRSIGEVVILNPFEVLGIESGGFNPLASLDPNVSTFIDDATGIGEALIKIEEKDPHWSESAQALLVALIMWEVKIARHHGRQPTLENVRYLLTQPNEYEKKEDGSQGEQIAGLKITAEKMCAAGGFEIESLAGRFLRENKEIFSIQSTADRQTSWMLSPRMRANMARNDLDFAALKERPITVYLILPAERMRTHSVWLRLIIVSALRALYRHGGLRTLFMLDEFAQLGHLAPIEDAFALVRGYGVQIWPVLQDLNQLKALYKERWETFVANAGVVQAFAPNDLTTARWMSDRAGDTTVPAAGFNTGDSASDAGQGSTSSGLSITQVKRPLFLPQEVMDFPTGGGLLWTAGSSKSIPFMAPSYWDVREVSRLAAPNPYYGQNYTAPAANSRAKTSASNAAPSYSSDAAHPSGAAASFVKGTIAEFDAANYRGTINGRDGKHYEFVMQDWREAKTPKAGKKVEFVPDFGSAHDVHFDDRVAALMANYPGPLRLNPTLLTRVISAWLLWCVGALALFCLASPFSNDPGPLLEVILFWFICCTIVGTLVTMVAVIIPGLITVILDREGFQERMLFRGDKTIWGVEMLADEKKFKLLIPQGGLSKKDFVRLARRWGERALAEQSQ